MGFKKTADGKNVRFGDPAAWSCLSDEQRDQIAEWYYNLTEEKRAEDKKKENDYITLGFISIAPLAAAMAPLDAKAADILSFYVDYFCAYLIAAFLWYIGSFYTGYTYRLDDKIDIAKTIAFLLIAPLVIFKIRTAI